MINEIQPKIKFQNIVQCPFNEDNFGMHGWVIGKATSEAHPFTMNLFDVYCRGEIVNDHSHSFLFVSPCIIIVPPCILVK